MTNWKSYHQNGTKYSLDHLHSNEIRYTPLGNPHGPVREYAIIISYSHHCFTRACRNNENPKPDEWYSHPTDRRVFDHDRYRYSQKLPELFLSIHEKQIWHSGQGNFLTVEMLTAKAVHCTYAVYFKLGQGKRGRGDLYLFVQSAYPRMDNPTPKKRRIRFQVLANDTFHGV